MTDNILVVHHDCYRQSFKWNDELERWECPVCGSPYVPPNGDLSKAVIKQDKPLLKYWKPWQMNGPRPKLFRWETSWYPERNYTIKIKKYH